MPGELDAPIAPWLFQVVGPLVFVSLVAYFVVDTYRNRALSFGATLLAACTTLWWQEWYGDWGAYILYSPRFALMDWRSTLWTTPNKPWAVIPAYGWFYGTVFPLFVVLVTRLRDRFPRRPQWVLIAAVTVPALYVWDLIVEGGAALLGWWSYVDYAGPAISNASGNFPLLYPILLNPLFGFVTVSALMWTDADGRRKVESIARVDRVSAGLRRELARIATWAVTINAIYLITLVGPIVVYRELFGHANVFVP